MGETIRIDTVDGWLDAECVCREGGLAVTRAWGGSPDGWGNSWKVTHVASGRSVHRWPFATAAAATSALRRLLRLTDWTRSAEELAHLKRAVAAIMADELAEEDIALTQEGD